MDVDVGGSITRKTAKATSLMFEELVKNNYQAPLERSMGRKLVGILELDRISAIEAKWGAFMNKLSPKSKKASTVGEMAYVHT